MRYAAADSAFVSHLDVANVRRALRQQRTNLLQQIRRLYLVMRGHGSDTNLAVFLANIRKIFDTADIHEQRRLREAQLHGRNQTVSTSENFCVFILSEKRHCLSER